MKEPKKCFSRALCACLAFALLPLFSSGCAAPSAEQPQDAKAGVTVIATLFPQYDFAKAIAGDHADVSLLLPPGVESHSFEPSPQDVIAISRADVFLYTGDYMEPWAATVASSIESGTAIVDVSAGLTLDEEDHDHGEAAQEHEHEHGGYDPHIWTDPVMAKTMVANIAAALAEADPENADAYRANADAYNARLDELDAEFAALCAGAKRTTICFGGRFALHYFAKRYGLTCIAAYDSCSSETEPSAKAVADIVNAVKRDGIPVVYYEELVDPRVANAIAEEAGVKTLLLHSCHNVSLEEWQGGASYLSLMEQNLENLRVGLN